LLADSRDRVWRCLYGSNGPNLPNLDYLSSITDSNAVIVEILALTFSLYKLDFKTQVALLVGLILLHHQARLKLAGFRAVSTIVWHENNWTGASVLVLRQFVETNTYITKVLRVITARTILQSYKVLKVLRLLSIPKESVFVEILESLSALF